ncbi:protein transporter Sec31 [Kitasatospora fiedleri]|uniref:protein transporter Sec31 n=1 Tax=Kitasatospora fiedleri TaxID=2991545 RepID=UPI00249A9CE5|nr:protein transporter Sec31 [Kitasatospora fiedleri]
MSLLTRTITRTRLVPFAPHPDAPVEMVPEEYTVEVPRDWDRAVLGAVAAGTGLLLALAVTWSTASIGGLLALNGVIAGVAYAVAAVFDLAWIICMALEWAARYDPRRAAAPRRAGAAFLAVSMAAIATREILPHGKAGIALGAIGAAVSLVAKGVWTLAIRATARDLTPVAQQYVARRQAAAGAELAMAQVDRQLARMRGQLDAYRQAYATSTAVTLDRPQPDPDRPARQPDRATATVRSAVRAALATTPGARTEELVEQLARLGIDTDANTVRTLSEELSGQHPDRTDSRSATVLALAPHEPDDTITDTVRAAVRTAGDDLDAVLAAVRRVHGTGVERDTVRRLLSRVAG